MGGKGGSGYFDNLHGSGQGSK
ncbi:BnaCnng23070D [Brassica napus]|uniref:BnaCnng23070D protein n=1 Tax=Brassica napus TaxID=3708 RepID=A0A078IT88_BRANA|nr:BnaCnng23070D [Brassica napus]